MADKWLCLFIALLHIRSNSTTKRFNESKQELFPNDHLKFNMTADSSLSLHFGSASSSSGHLAFIDDLLQDYDKRVWPTYDTDKPTVVTVNININSLGEISAANMDFSMDIYLRQSWLDPRLQFRHLGKNHSVTLNAEELADKIWKPDTFFRNLKSGNFHSLTVPNKLIRLFPDGNVLFSMRLTLRLSCYMSFRLYPLDTQKCYIILGSYAQTADQVLLKWRDPTPITIEEGIQIPEFHVVMRTPRMFLREIDTGSFSFLNVSLVFMRENGYHLVQTYLPTFLIVMMSWISFWVPVDSAPARVTLGVTTLLSLSTVASGVRSQLPPVSYAKAIDIWIGACSIMVFAALLEFAFASYLSRMKIRNEDRYIGCVAFRKAERSSLPSDGKNMPSPEMAKKIQIRRSNAVDRVSRVAFPFIFFAFNMFYWIYYLWIRAQIEMKYFKK